MRFLSALMGKRWFWLTLFLIETVILAYLSLVKAPTFRIGPDEENRIAHFAAYIIYGFTCAMWQVSSRSGKTTAKDVFSAIGWCLLYGVVMETGQLFLPNRDPDFLDGICNAAGGLIGVLAGFRIASFVKDYKPRSIS